MKIMLIIFSILSFSIGNFSYGDDFGIFPYKLGYIREYRDTNGSRWVEQVRSPEEFAGRLGLKVTTHFWTPDGYEYDGNYMLTYLDGNKMYYAIPQQNIFWSVGYENPIVHGKEIITGVGPTKRKVRYEIIPCPALKVGTFQKCFLVRTLDTPYDSWEIFASNVGNIQSCVKVPDLKIYCSELTRFIFQ